MPQHHPPSPESAGHRPAFLPPAFGTPDHALRTESGGRVVLRDIEVTRTPGFRPVRMDLHLPTTPAPAPVVIWIHGGAFRFGSRLDGAVTAPVREALLARGLAVAAVEYRLSGEALFPACLHDVKAAVRWLRAFGAQAGIDPTAIGVWGESAGGHLSAYLGMNSPEPEINGDEGVAAGSSDVDAAVAWYPPVDFLTMDAQSDADALMSHDDAASPESRLVGGPIQDLPEATAFASPARHVRAGAAPMLLVHGLRDRNVPYRQSVDLRDRLQAAGVEVRLELIEDAGHVFDGVDRQPIIELSADWILAHLAPRADEEPEREETL